MDFRHLNANKRFAEEYNYEAPLHEHCLMERFLLMHSLKCNQDDRIKEAEK
jgi:hypothetical protein